jgi:hypothetical protein
MLAACGGTPSGAAQVSGPQPPPHAQVTAQPAHGGSPAAAPLIATAPDIGCAQTSCAFHAGAATYLTCLSGGAGACFHFGGPCTPADACMFDPSDRAYKHCARAVEGTCAQWAGACAPASACMFDPDDGLHHHCDDVAAGGCHRYGALCAP